jgi:uncharacterized protein DUF6152
MFRSKVMLSGAAMLLLSAPGHAHHSGAMFDATREQTIVGAVTEFNWTNPHSSFKVDVKAADGKDVTWAIEMNSPQNLLRQGWKRTTLKPGDVVTVVIHPLRDGSPGGQYLSVKLPDGKVLGEDGAG